MEVDGGGLRNSCAAASRLLRPCRTRRTTCSSCAVKFVVVEGSRFRAVSPEARSSCLARSAPEPRPLVPNQSQPAPDPQSALHNFVVTSNRQQYDAVTLAGNVMDEWESYLRIRGCCRSTVRRVHETLTARVEPFVERPTRAPTSRPRPGHGQRRRLPGRADRRAAIAASTTATGATDHVARLLRRRLLDGARGRPDVALETLEPVSC